MCVSVVAPSGDLIPRILAIDELHDYAQIYVNGKLATTLGWFTAALQVPEVKAKLVVQGLYPVWTCGADFGAFLRKQYDDYGRAIREANIKVE